MGVAVGAGVGADTEVAVGSGVGLGMGIAVGAGVGSGMDVAAGADVLAGAGVGPELEQANRAATVTRIAPCSIFGMLNLLNLLNLKILSAMVLRLASGDVWQTLSGEGCFPGSGSPGCSTPFLREVQLEGCNLDASPSGDACPGRRPGVPLRQSRTWGVLNSARECFS